ncbi:MAG: hypothetical protein LH654_08345 [Thermoleophilia bacterium]|nr:hypothetical protein [Thermoleophilia bacterium]
MHVPPLIRGSVLMRSVSLVFGLLLFALGIVLLLESGLGLSPWDVLAQGISDKTSLSFGTANIAIAVVVLVVAWALGARIGLGTVANAVLIGLFVDWLIAIDAVDALSDAALAIRIVLMIAGILIIGIGTGFYVGAGMGAGPRDSLMLVTSRRSGARIGITRATIEVAVTVLGFALGGTVGIGTLAFAFGIGPAVELSFWLLERSPIAKAAQNASHAV